MSAAPLPYIFTYMPAELSIQPLYPPMCFVRKGKATFLLDTLAHSSIAELIALDNDRPVLMHRPSQQSCNHVCHVASTTLREQARVRWSLAEEQKDEHANVRTKLCW